MPSHPRPFLGFIIARSLVAAAAVAAATALLLAVPARAEMSTTVSLSSSGTSVVGTPIAGLASLTFSGTTLTVSLANVSSATSASKSDLLTSFYFDIVKSGSIRPTLTYVSGSGYAWQVFTAAPDVAVNYSPPSPGGLTPSGTGPHIPANLVATAKNDNTWQFRSWALGTSQWDVTRFPQVGFGIGTVGNGGTTSGTFFNTFTGSIVDGVDFGIYRADGDLTVANNSLNRLVLVRNSATFVFTSPDLPAFSCDDVQPYHLFGFGSDPETALTPEPGVTAILATAAAAAGAWRIRRRHRTSPAQIPRSGGSAAAGSPHPAPIPAAGPASRETSTPAATLPKIPIVPVVPGATGRGPRRPVAPCRFAESRLESSCRFSYPG